MVEPGVESWSFDLIVSFSGSSGAALLNLVPMSQKGSGLKFPQCQAETAKATYQPIMIRGRKPGPWQKPEAAEGVEETGGRSCGG